MIRVYIAPNYLNVPKHADNGGIRRVVEAQLEHLHKFGIQVIPNINDAQVICNHGTTLAHMPGIPIVNVNHGFMWSRQAWGDGYMDINRQLVEAIHAAVAHTVPSEWVGRAMRRGGYYYPEVVYHGVNPDDFKPSDTPGNYVLWNKARADLVSDPNDAMKVARMLPEREFRLTIGLPDHNVKILDVIPHDKMKEVVAGSGVYLSTVRETFGIGVLEALASGVPVAGFDWGGNSEIIVQGQTGYLAPPGDFAALAECIERCFAERDRLSANAIDDVRSRWTWEPRIQQYAEIFKRVHEKHNKPGPKVSVIVTAYNLDDFLPKCLDSVREQTFDDFECIVVDDAQSDSTRRIVEAYARSDKRFRYNPTPENMGLSGARNYGLSCSSGKFIRHLDADDFLAGNTLELESSALEGNIGIDIAYGHLEVVRSDGSQFTQNGEPVRGGWPSEKFNWYQQMAHLNQLPSCVMARREVFERSGGYRSRMYRNEDAEFWCRVTSLGFRAHKFTQAVTYYHRERHDSKGALEWQNEGGEGDWTAWFPWRMGAKSFEEAQQVIRKRGESPRNSHIVPFGAQGKPPRGLPYWYVHDYAYPVVSVIVTCGPGHKQYLIDALDSIQAQTYPDWECIVVNDTGEDWPADIMGAPWAKVVNMPGNRGTSEARNEGYRHAKGRFIIWMDADDFWVPWFLEKMVGYAEINNGVIYSDLIFGDGPKEFKIYPYPNFNEVYEQLPEHMIYPGSSVMYPRWIVDSILELQGGYDTKIPGMEDYDYQLAVHHLGYCAYRVPEPLFVYRRYTTTKREADFGRIDKISAYLDEKWKEYRKGERKIMCGCGGSKAPIAPMPSSMLSSSGNFTSESINQVADPENKAQMVVLEYIGPVKEPFTVSSRMANDVRYRFANNDQHRFKPVFLGDAEYLLSMIGPEGYPLYRSAYVQPADGANDPAAFLSQPITA